MNFWDRLEAVFVMAEKFEGLRYDVENLHVKVDKLLKLEKASAQREVQMAIDLSDLQAKVAKDVEVDQSAITLLGGLKAKIDELIANSGNTVDPAQLQALSDAIGTSTQSLADAVVANTPAA